MKIEEIIGDMPCVEDRNKKVWRLRKQPYGHIYVALKDDNIVFGGTIHHMDLDLFEIPQSTVYKKRWNINPFLEKAMAEINHRSEGEEDETRM